MRDRLRATGHPEEDVDILAELFAEDVQEWPGDAWLAIDDYHFAMESSASERFVDLLTQQIPVQMLITSRRRPSWATARRILYGEILELDRRTLAMDDKEAREALGDGHPYANDLVVRIRGWPALVGLAALSVVPPQNEASLPSGLYEYFAEELLQGLTPAVQVSLGELAVLPTGTPDLVNRFLGAAAAETLAEASRVGVVSKSEQGFELHPLLRQFLLTRITEAGRAEARRVADRAVRVLLSERRWDEAFDVVVTLSAPGLIADLLAAALEDLLHEGRTQTIAQWVEEAHANQVGGHVTDLAEAELAFRQGDWAKAEALALTAADGFTNGSLRTRALIRAGHAARLDSRDDLALVWFREAVTSADTDAQRFEALVGEYFALLEMGLERDLDDVASSLDALTTSRPEMVVRRAMADLVRATRLGGITEALEVTRVTLPLLAKVKDPLVKSSFQNGCAHLSALNCRYEEALEFSEDQLDFAERYRLDFALSPAHLVRALAFSGLREFSRAREEIHAADERARSHDLHIAMWSAALRARIALDHGEYERAFEYARTRWDRPAAPPMQAELLAYADLAASCVGDAVRRRSIHSNLAGIRAMGVEATALMACADAIQAIVAEGEDVDQQAARALETIERTGAYDCAVTAFRAFPDLVPAVANVEGGRETVATILQRSNDRKMADAAGLPHDGLRRGPLGQLTPRERDVARLIGQGLSNRMIAAELYITEATVKVHVRHILEKLGGRSRAEIAARAADVD
jgi:ATP/maltotriose-dependent transcriptional regulator MalT